MIRVPIGTVAAFIAGFALSSAASLAAAQYAMWLALVVSVSCCGAVFAYGAWKFDDVEIVFGEDKTVSRRDEPPVPAGLPPEWRCAICGEGEKADHSGCARVLRTSSKVLS